MNNEKKPFVPQWILDSETAPDEVNKDVDKIVGGYVAAFMKRGFSQKQIGSLMVKAFSLPLEEVERRIDSVLSCAASGEEESARTLCVYAVSKGHLFSGDNSDPCEIIEIIKEQYGKTAAFETILQLPEILSFWKKAEVRGNYIAEKEIAEGMLQEVKSVFGQ